MYRVQLSYIRELTEIKLIKFLDELFAEYRISLSRLPAAAKWDMKGQELYFELHEKFYNAFNHKAIHNININGINLNILDYDKREDIKKSYGAGKDFEESFAQKIDGIAIKFAVWDYLAGMTDNFIIKNYEDLTFKRVELR
jgi:dGTP triphosphohydrolase